MEREAKVQPLDLYCDTLTMNRALKDRGSKVKEEIKRTVDEIWETGQQLSQSSQRHRGSQREARQRPPTGAEHVLQRAIEREQEIHAYQAWLAQQPRRARRPRANRPPPGQPQKVKTAIDEWADLEWERRWRQKARKGKATIWRTPWQQNTMKLYSDMPKHQATALFLLRTEVIGLNGWLASISVPGIKPECGCGWPTQSVHHVLMMCPLYTASREQLVSRMDSEEMWRMLSTPEKAQATARWFVQQGILQQFNLAKEIEEEDTGNHASFKPLEGALQDFP